MNLPVYPYATVLPPRPYRVLYLPGAGGRIGAPFPADMPELERHLTPFKPVLEDAVRRYRVNRPWWSIHNDRAGFLAGHERKGAWADLAFTTRWGDGKLVSGLAPSGTLPLSGLHMIRGGKGVSTAFLVGLFNSSPVQELAEGIAPGSVSQDDLEALQLPRLSDDAEGEISRLVLALADDVDEIVSRTSTEWPSLETVVRWSSTGEENVLGAWCPRPEEAGWGQLRNVRWLRIETGGHVNEPIEGVETVNDLFGTHVRASAPRGHVNLGLPEDDPELLAIVESVAAGIAWNRGTIEHLLRVLLPIDAGKIRLLHQRALVQAARQVTAYDDKRNAIDDIVEIAVG